MKRVIVLVLVGPPVIQYSTVDTQRLHFTTSIMATYGYTPLASSIVNSSVWALSHASLRIWFYMLAMQDREGRVLGSPPVIAHNCYMQDEQEFRRHLQPLLDPDPASGSTKEDGRRLLPIPGGWFVVNGREWKDRFADERAKERKRAWIAEKRKKQAESRKKRQAKAQQELEGAEAAQSLIRASEQNGESRP